MKRYVACLLAITLFFPFISHLVIPAHAEPTLLEVLTNLGFTNVAETDVSTFPSGVYNITLYAEFAGYANENELSYYQTGTETYNIIFTGPEGGSEYIVPPVSKTFTINFEFGISMLSPGPHRYFTENNLNPDGQTHNKVYRNLDDPSMYLIGFENTYGSTADRDYQDMVFSIRARSQPQASFTWTPPTPKMLEQVNFDASGSSAEEAQSLRTSGTSETET